MATVERGILYLAPFCRGSKREGWSEGNWKGSLRPRKPFKGREVEEAVGQVQLKAEAVVWAERDRFVNL